MRPTPLAPLAPLARRALHLSTHARVIEAPGAPGLFAVQIFGKDGRPGLLFGSDGLLWIFESASYAQACLVHAHDGVTILPADRVI